MSASGPMAVGLQSAENDAGCGGCRDVGAHRRHCPRHPDYHPWKRLADMAESIGDSIGANEPGLANRAYFLAGAIREAMPDHPYRPAQTRVTPPVETCACPPEWITAGGGCQCPTPPAVPTTAGLLAGLEATRQADQKTRDRRTLRGQP